MMRTPSTWLAVALAGAALLAGCGGSKSKSATTSTAATSVPQATATGATSPAGAQTTTTTSAAPHTATTNAAPPTTSPNAGATAPRIPRFKGNLAERTKQAVAFCKQRIRAQPGPASTKAALERLCEEAGSTNPAVTRQAARELCVMIVNSSAATGVTKERALARCKHG
jgi:hypothetical protein